MKLKGKLMNILLSAAVLIGSLAVPAASVSAADASLLPAFPGAEGAGKYSTGGRGGTVRIVTKLTDDGSVGTFREAVSHSNSIVVFAVGGTINLTKGDVVVKGNVTIAGQTAPGGKGIVLRNGKIGMGGDNIIVRFISSRPGEKGSGSGDYDAWGGNKGSNSIIDHCSLGFANDEQFGLYSTNMNQTVQYTIIGPSNCVSYHSKGAHGFGAMFGKGQNSWHHNLLCHSLSRNFRGKVEKGNEPMDFTNNVIYDWGYQTAYGTLGHINYANNYLKEGPSTKGGDRFLNNSSGSSKENYKFYVTGNTIRKKDDSVYSSAIEQNNWSGVSGFDAATYQTNVPFKVPAVNGEDASTVNNLDTAEEGYKKVVRYSGAGVHPSDNTAAGYDYTKDTTRPLIDARVLYETYTGTGSLTGARPFDTVSDSAVKSAISKYGIQYMDYDQFYPKDEIKQEIADSDSDGMDDAWELERGLNVGKNDSKEDYLGEGYTNIEYYINDLTVDAFPEGVVTPTIPLGDLGEDYKKALDDAKAITLSADTIKTADQLTLPSVGSVNGCPITWSSASEMIVIENNKVTAVNRPEDEDEVVSLLAEITSGEYTMKKYFNITVKSTSTVWTASSGDADKKAGYEPVDGLTALFDITSSGSTSAAVGEKSFGYFVSGAENGGWADGKATGTAFKFVPESDGFLTAYIEKLGGANPKTAYIMEEGAAKQEENNLASVTGTGDNEMLTAAVEGGKTYYVYVAGSKGHFLGIEFGKEAPAKMWKASKEAKKGDTLMEGLTVNEDMTFTPTKKDIDSVYFTGRIQGTTNPGQSGATGASMTFVPNANGRVTVYYKIGGLNKNLKPKTFKINEPGMGNNPIVSYVNENEPLDGDDMGTSEYTSTSADVYANHYYYIYIEGSKAEFYGVSFQMTADAAGGEGPIITPEPLATAAPTATPVPMEGETWDFNNLETGKTFSNGDKVSGTGGRELTVNFGTSAKAPAIAEKAAGDNYLTIDDQGTGSDGWSYAPESPSDSDIVVAEEEFKMGDDKKDAVLMRFYDTNNVSADNAYITAKDGRAFEVKTADGGGLKITDYLSKGDFTDASKPKGLDVTVSGFTFKANEWYGLKVEFNRADNIVTVYTKSAGGEYSKRSTVKLGSKEPKGTVPKLALTSIGCVTRGSSSNVLGIDNVYVGWQTDAPQPTDKPQPTEGPQPTVEPQPGSVIEFTQGGEKIDSFADGEVTFAVSGLENPCRIIIAGYDASGALIGADIAEYDPSSGSAAAAVTPTADTVTIRGFIWDGTENIKPMTDVYEIKRK